MTPLSAKDIPDPASFGSSQDNVPSPKAAPLKIDLAAAERRLRPTNRPSKSWVQRQDRRSPLLSRSMVIGLPLAAFVLLVGLFWSILRRGAV